MKLRNLLFGTMIACAFVACSNDDDPNPTPVEAADAYLNIDVTTKSQTKAAGGDANALSSEIVINNLTIVAFNGEGNRLGYQRATLGTGNNTFKANNDGTYTFNNPIKIKAVDVNVYVVANVAENELSSLNTESAFLDKTATLSQDISSIGLLMSSNAVAVTAANLTGTSADVAFNSTVTIQRVAARVQLTKVSVNFPNENEKLELLGALLINGRTDSRISVAEAGATLDYGKAGSQAFGYGQYLENSYSENGGLLVTNKGTLNVDFWTGLTGVLKNGAQTSVATFLSEGNPTKYFYVMPNDLISLSTNPADGKAYTLLSICGKYTDSEGIEMGVRYYTVKIALDNVVAGTNTGGKVIRNTVYDVEVTLTGSGSTDPVNPESTAYLNASVSVADWSYVKQTPTVD